MPLIEPSSYIAPVLFRQAHFNTIYAALFRKIAPPDYQRETLETPDGDFLDLDWRRQPGADRLLIALHGLEGSADRPYIRGILQEFFQHGWEGLGVNFRGCSGRPNRQPRSYHMGATDDLDLVLRHIHAHGRYRTVVLVGFSLGGNVLLKYIGERGDKAVGVVDAAVAFSVPCHIPSANIEIDKWYNYLYLQRFLRSLHEKIQEKARRFPGLIDLSGPAPRSFREFDDRYTAPLHGFRDATDYWESCSSLRFLPEIRLPVLLVNALDDTFLSKACYPVDLARDSPYLFLEMPKWGGHVGFATYNGQGAYWSEQRARAFVEARVAGLTAEHS